ncbi:346_t:CDS:2 [Acaulospora colombiana]|uniref:346_t:CDS:1 n=1 Tax=Acaulospora colombiana TaxID=27376 RepID=A0ACA9MVP9_9GLOM|nr:346_t:CDS:2 [Acaulospora colombiana]
MTSNAPIAQTHPNGQVVQSSPQGSPGHAGTPKVQNKSHHPKLLTVNCYSKAGAELIQTRSQNAIHSRGQCPHTASGPLANSEIPKVKTLDGSPPKAIDREAGENDAAEVGQTAEDSAMDVEGLQASQATLEAYVTSYVIVSFHLGIVADSFS